jgi:putative FmdB family regulatory protein
MPTYEYTCQKCDLSTEVVKSIHEYQSPEHCTQCGNLLIKVFSGRVHFVGTKIEDAEYNVGLGEVTKSKRHREEIARRKGAIELGNEKPDSVHKHQERILSDRLKKSWDEV